MKPLSLLVVVFMLLAGCEPATVNENHEAGTLETALASITAEDLAADIQVLASDEFEGRAPSSLGEEKTINFLKTEFETLGLQPGNGDSFFQEVPLVEITADPNITFTVEGNGANASYGYGSDVMTWTKRVVETVDLEASELVFVGYGVVAPEYHWNDYEGLDVAGKTVVILVNDPGYATQDSSLFNGNAMTYYGRWTYKYEEAARQGATAAFIVHETEPAGYPWEVVSGSWSGPQFDLVASDDNMGRVAVEGWWTLETARKIFQQAGQDYDALKAKAVQTDFKAVSLGLNATTHLQNTLRRSTSNNVLAVWPGSERPDEYIVYMGHWDHLGKDETLEGDQIYNGAIDNGTGTAALLEMAEAFTKMPAPKRSILFMAVTAEEQGLLGSAYYGQNPVYPTRNTVAAINMDALGAWGRTKDVIVVGYGASALDDYIEEAAQAQGRYIRPDAEPEKGYYYRSDHFSFAKQGIPALYADAGIDHLEKGEAYGRAQAEDYTAHRYHKPADEYNAETWDLSGMVENVQLLFRVGHQLAGEDTFPQWREGNEFKAIREADLAGE